MWMRIFTPAKEIPFAGHPSVGTAYVMARAGRFPLQEPVTRIWIEVIRDTAGMPTTIRVGGTTVLVIRGTIETRQG